MSAYRPAPLAWCATSAGSALAGEQRVERGLVQPPLLAAEQVSGERLAHQRVPERELVVGGLDQHALVDKRAQRRDQLGLVGPGHRRQQVERHPVAEHRGRFDDPARRPASRPSIWRCSTSAMLHGSGCSPSVGQVDGAACAPAADRSSSSRKNGFPPVRWCSAIAARYGTGSPVALASSAAVSAGRQPLQPQVRRPRGGGPSGPAARTRDAAGSRPPAGTCRSSSRWPGMSAMRSNSAALSESAQCRSSKTITLGTAVGQ